MTRQEIETKCSEAHRQLLHMPEINPVILNKPIYVQIFDQNRDEVITHLVTSVQRIGINIFLDNAYHEETENEDQEGTYTLTECEENTWFLDVFDACKEARPDLFTDQSAPQ